MSIPTLRQAISNHPFRPPAILVGVSLWDDLKKENLIQYQIQKLVGTNAATVKVAIFDNDIIVEIADLQDPNSFMLPTQSK